MTEEAAMVGNLRDLRNKLDWWDDFICDGFKKAEAKKEERDVRRKTLVLAELKAWLKSLHTVDSELLKDIKHEVFDRREAIRLLRKEVVNLSKSMKSPGAEDYLAQMKRGFEEVTSKMDALNAELQGFSG